MHRARVNQCDITVSITAPSPLCVLEGRYKKVSDDTKRVEINKKPFYLSRNPELVYEELPDNIPVSRNTDESLLGIFESYTKSAGLTGSFACLDYYLPGASLRGVLRGYAEKVLRSLSRNPEDPMCCNPLTGLEAPPDQFCGKYLEKMKMDGPTRKSFYSRQCPICSLFGSTVVAGRIRVPDFRTETRGHLVLRDSVALDRFTGGPKKGAIFRSLLLEGYTFQGTLVINNFESWHLGLMAFLLYDLCSGKMPVGWGKSKGYGEVKASVDQVCLHYYGRNDPGKKLMLIKGIEHLGYEAEALYGHPVIEVGEGVLAHMPGNTPFRHTYRVASPSMKPDSPFWGKVAESFIAFWQAFESLRERRYKGEKI